MDSIPSLHMLISKKRVLAVFNIWKQIKGGVGEAFELIKLIVFPILKQISL
jgi:hypothetical protein